MLDIIIITIGKLKEKSYLDLSNEYLKRLQPYAKVKVIELKAEGFSDNNQEKAKEIEGGRIEKTLEKYREKNVYLLGERGKIFDSIELANWLNREAPLVLVVGGALGFSEKLYNGYPKLSLSALTFPHETARVILLEQIYRSTTILNSKKYHY